MKFFRWGKRKLVDCIYWMMAFINVSAIFGFSYNALLEKKYETLGYLCFPLLAILYGFTATLYNRSRALTPGHRQRRTMYAAERSFQALVLFLAGIALGGISILLTLAFGNAPHYGTYYFFLFLSYAFGIGSILMFLFSYLSFFLAFRAMANKFAKRILLKDLYNKL